MMLGMGMKSCIKVKADSQGKMCPIDLEEKIKHYQSNG